MRLNNRFLSSLGLLALLIAGLYMMGNGLGDNYVFTSQQKSGWLTLFGLIICLGSGYLMTFISPGPKGRSSPEDQLS